MGKDRNTLGMWWQPGQRTVSCLDRWPRTGAGSIAVLAGIRLSQVSSSPVLTGDSQTSWSLALFQSALNFPKSVEKLYQHLHTITMWLDHLLVLIRLDFIFFFSDKMSFVRLKTQIISK